MEVKIEDNLVIQIKNYSTFISEVLSFLESDFFPDMIYFLEGKSHRSGREDYYKSKLVMFNLHKEKFKVSVTKLITSNLDFSTKAFFEINEFVFYTDSFHEYTLDCFESLIVFDDGYGHLEKIKMEWEKKSKEIEDIFDLIKIEDISIERIQQIKVPKFRV